MHSIRFEGVDFAPVADFDLLRAAVDAARSGDGDHAVHVGPVLSSDSFYPARPELVTRMAEHGVLAVEMEASALYTVAARHGRRALAVCTVSDHLLTGVQTTAQEREQTFGEMVRVALVAALAPPDRGRSQGRASSAVSAARSGRSAGSTTSPVRT